MKYKFSLRCYPILLCLLGPVQEVLFPTCVFGQQEVLRFERISNFEHFLVNSINQDSFGFIWVNTSTGLSRYDGYRFISMGNARTGHYSFADIAMGKVFKDASGVLWLGGPEGLYRYDPQKDFFHYFRNHAAISYLGHEPTAFKQDSEGTIWVGTMESLLRQDPTNGKFSRIPIANAGTVPFRVNDIAEDKNGNLWVAAEPYGLWRLTGGQDTLRYNYAPRHTDSHLRNEAYRIKAIWIDRQQHIWICSRGGIFVWDPFRQKLMDSCLPDSLRTAPANCMLDDGLGNLWIGTVNQGLIRWSLRDSVVTHYHADSDPEFGLGDNRVYCLFRDSHHNLWVGTEAGLYKANLKTGRFPHYRPFPGGHRKDNNVYRIREDANGGVWIANNSGEIYYAESLGKKVRPMTPPAVRNKMQDVMCFFADSDGTVWVTYKGGGVFHFARSGSRWTIRDRTELFYPKSTINAIIADSKDPKILWFCGNGLWRYHRLEQRPEWFSPVSEGVAISDHIENMTGTPDGNILINKESYQSSTLCLFKTDSLKFQPLEIEPTYFEKHFTRFVRSFVWAPDGKVWMATPNGCYGYDLRVQPGKLVHFEPVNGLPNRDVNAVLCDDKGRLWLSLAGYITRLEPGDSRFLHFPVFDGVVDFHSMSSSTGKGGRLYFGGLKGFYAFFPDSIRQDSSPFRVVLTDFKVVNKSRRFGTALELLNDIVLRHEDNVFSFEFSALYFLSSQLNRYQYRLEGFDPDWVEAGEEHKATYTNLSPGKYTFYARACNADGVWNKQMLTIRLTILPPWYRTWWAYLLYALTFIGILLGIRRFELRRQLAKAENRRLQELDTVKTKLYTNITHEFRTPLTVILGETAQLEKQAGKTQKSGLDAIRRQGRHLLNLVNQMLDLAKVESGSLHLNMVQGNVVLFLKYLLESFHSLADSKQIELRFETDADEFWMDYDPDKLQKIASNLISNAIKFTPQSGRVEMRVTSEGFQTLPTLDITVSDTGQGIPPEKLPFVFERFYQADDSATRQAEGTGIGLTLTKELVQLLGGQISVESRLGEGSTFIVALPVTRSAEKQQLKPEVIFTENQEMKPEPEASAVPNFQFPISNFERPISNFEQNRPHLLLIEDNADVIRYLSSLLAADYQIHRAGNGREGLEAALRLVPDLIISDVMMPEMDGFELCRALKTDVRSSHIPVILLTAKADLDSRIEGLEHGADAYLAKPFEERELKVQLRKLHELRQALRERYGQPGVLAPSDLPAFRREDVFFQKLNSVLVENYSRAAFGVPEFCTAMTMSRPNLFRKLTALTGKNIEDYLRYFRLHKAHELLRTTDLNVQEVAWDCGFNDAAHFTRVFHAEFGINPSQVR